MSGQSAELAIQVASTAQTGRVYAVAKRAFDIGFAGLVLILFAPLVVLAALAIRIESRGPVFFRQARMGRDGSEFRLVKLRGMYEDARERFPELYDYDSHGHIPADEYVFHPESDPRVTRVGRVLRRFSVDELPNFWNVLRGDMSVVGPRPEIPELAYLYGDDLDLLLSVRPGVTSPAKARTRADRTFASTLARELDYVRRRSFALDVTTIARTFVGVSRGEGR